jgi:ribosomal protein S11
VAPTRSKASKPSAKKVRRKERRTSLTAHASHRARSTTPIISITDPTGAVIVLGIIWSGRLQGHRASPLRSPHSWPPKPPPAARWSTACKKVDVLRQGPGLRPRDRDPLTAGHRASRLARSPDVTPLPHNGCRPKRRRGDRLTQERTRAWLVTPERNCKRCRREKVKLYLKGSKCDPRSARSSRVPTHQASTARGRIKERVTAPDSARSRSARVIYGVLEKQFRGYYEEANRPPRQDRREPARASWRAVSTTWSTAPASRSAVTHGPSSWCVTVTSRRERYQGRHPVVPVSQIDIIDVRAELA